MPGDAMTKFSHKCSHAVEATSSISKEEIQVIIIIAFSACCRLRTNPFYRSFGRRRPEDRDALTSSSWWWRGRMSGTWTTAP